MKNRYLWGMACSISLSLGIGAGYLLYQVVNSQKKTFDTDYIYKGREDAILSFKMDSDGLFESDSTISASKNDLIDSPLLASEIANAIFQDHYSVSLIRDNYPFGVWKDTKTWEISGLCQNRKENIVYFGGVLQLFIARKNGMVCGMVVLK